MRKTFFISLSFADGYLFQNGTFSCSLLFFITQTKRLVLSKRNYSMEKDYNMEKD